MVRFQTEAKKCIQEIGERGHLPILVGGTGFYIQAVLYDIDFTEEEPDVALRKELTEYAKTHGEKALHERLFAVDPASAEKIHAHNIKRVIRAIEYYQTTGKRISEHNEEQQKKESPYRFLYAVLTLPREELYERIDVRVDRMIEAGLEDEVRRLIADGVPADSTAMKGLGYKEIAGYLNGEYDLEEAIYILKRDTRHFAKRQLTWYKREKAVTYFDKKEYPTTDALVEAICNKANDAFH